jgi:nucleoside-diphosphate-sugar epimerase
MIEMFQQLNSKMATAKKIVVCGGNGFLGSRICKSAVARGWDVTSIRYFLPSIPLQHHSSLSRIEEYVPMRI